MLRKVGTAMLVLIAAAACSSGDDGTSSTQPYPGVFQFSSDVRLSGLKNVVGEVGDCKGVGPWAPLAPGKPAWVLDPEGNTLATGKIEFATGTSTYFGRLEECTFRVVVGGVPRRPEYVVKLGPHKTRVVKIAEIFAGMAAVPLDINKQILVPSTSTTTTATTTTTIPD